MQARSRKNDRAGETTGRRSPRKDSSSTCDIHFGEDTGVYESCAPYRAHSRRQGGTNGGECKRAARAHQSERCARTRGDAQHFDPAWYRSKTLDIRRRGVFRSPGELADAVAPSQPSLLRCIGSPESMFQVSTELRLSSEACNSAQFDAHIRARYPWALKFPLLIVA